MTSYGSMERPGLILACLLLGGCSSAFLSSQQEPGKALGDGVIYYMPEQPIKVSIAYPAPTKKNAYPAGVPTAEAVTPVADLSHQFLLNYDKSYFGKNHLKLNITGGGLLTSINADTTSGMVAIVQNLGKSVGEITVLAGVLGLPVKHKQPAACPVGGTYSKLLTLSAFASAGHTEKLCDFTIKITDMDGNAPRKYPDSKHLTENESHAGLFYKQLLPYKVEITDPDHLQPSVFITYLPDFAPIGFVPATETLFSNSQTNVTLDNGILTSLEDTSDGEVVGASELPADLITAYATAVGSLLTQVGTNVQSQATLLTNQKALTVAQAQNQACQTAATANKAALDPANLKGKTGSELASAVDAINAAVANIKAACTTQ